MKETTQTPSMSLPLPSLLVSYHPPMSQAAIAPKANIST
jgi:hypothetical protein